MVQAIGLPSAIGVHPEQVGQGGSAQHFRPRNLQIGIFRPVDVAFFEVEAVEPQQGCLLAGDIRRHGDRDALVGMILNVAVPQLVFDGERKRTCRKFRPLHCLHHVWTLLIERLVRVYQSRAICPIS